MGLRGGLLFGLLAFNSVPPPPPLPRWSRGGEMTEVHRGL